MLPPTRRVGVVEPLPWDVPGRLQGVDVSAAQWRALSWKAIHAAGCRFASIKISENLSPDHMFAAHAAGAAAEDLDLQAYGFVHSSSPGALQAEAMSRALDRAKVTLRAREVVDWEDVDRMDVRKGGIGPGPALRNGMLPFLRRLHELRGRRPASYTGNFVLELMRDKRAGELPTADELAELGTYDLWIAAYRWDTLTGHDYGLVLPHIPAPWSTAYAWQCGGNGAPRIPGVDVDLDRDVFFGDAAAWAEWCADAPTKEAGLRLGDDGAVTTIADEVNRSTRGDA